MSEKTLRHQSEPTPEKQRFFLFWFFSWFFRRPGMQLLFIIVSLLLPALTMILFVVLPAMGFDPLPKAEWEAELPADAKKAEITSDMHPMLLDVLEKEQKLNFLKSRLELARQDSIYLVLNLKDSMLDIEIKGLPVQHCKLLDISVSNRLKVAQHEDLQQWLSTPFTLKGEHATIPKVPFLVVDAPKDTNEAAKLPKKPMEPEKTAVFFTLAFDRNLVLQVEQIQPVIPEEESLVQVYRQKTDSLYGRNFVEKILQPMPDELPVYIRLKMNEGDARAVYRSIPHVGFARMIISPVID